MRAWFVALLALGACSGKQAEAPRVGAAAPHDLDVVAPNHATAPAVDAAGDDAVGGDAAGGDDAAPEAPPAPSADRAADFTPDMMRLFRVAACGDASTPVPPEVAGGDPHVAKIVLAHCKRLADNVTKFRAAYFAGSGSPGARRKFFDALVPADIPTTVVYPFGGGDLLSALVAFPNATEITTISLEQAGDPRRVTTLTAPQLEASLAALRVQIGGLIQVGSNTSVNLMAQQRNGLPGQVSSFLLGLAVAGFEPVAMHYFTLEPSGAIHYYTQAEIDALDAKGGKQLKGDWGLPNFSEAFGNVEIQYRKPGETTLRTHRHFGWNLGDAYLAQHPELVAHLEAKGKVTVLVKGASYLLWRGDFGTIRDYLTSHLAWMLSDSTGIPPRYAHKAGLVQIPYGQYDGAFLEGARGGATDADVIALFATGHPHSLGFRFGYTDLDKHGHVIVTRPK